MKKIKLIIIFIVVTLILIIGAIIALNIRTASLDDVETQPSKEEKVDTTEIENLTQRSDYFILKTCMQMYCQTLNTENSSYYGYDDNGTQVKQIDDNAIYTKIYNVLSSNYINKNNITVSNIRKYVKTLKMTDDFIIVDAKCLSDTENDTNSTEDIVSYAICGYMINTINYTTDEKCYAIVTIDRNNLLFSVEPVDANKIEDVKLSNIKVELAKNDDNQFTYPTLTTDDIAKDYINTMKELSLAEPEEMYNKLNAEYADKRFGNKEEYKKYVNENKANIISTKLSKYQINNYDDYTEYICIDQNDNYYIVNEKSILNYTIILDAYTVDIPEIANKYNSGNISTKVGMNIEKIRIAINNKDYKYIYNKLYDTFKTNKFSTENEMANYLKTNLFDNNKFEYSNAEEENGTYMCKIKVTDSTGKDSTTKNLNMVIKLEEGTDFVISFSMQ